MATLTIRNLDDRVKQELRKRAAVRGVSMEQEARTILEVVDSIANTAAGERVESDGRDSDGFERSHGAFDWTSPSATAVREACRPSIDRRCSFSIRTSYRRRSKPAARVMAGLMPRSRADCMSPAISRAELLLGIERHA